MAFVLSGRDRAELQAIINEARTRRANTPLHTQVNRSISHGVTMYVAKTPAEGLESIDYSVDPPRPGVGDCTIYRISLTNTDIESTGSVQRVYNVAEAAVDGLQFIPIVKDGYGRWIAIHQEHSQTGTGTGTGTTDSGSSSSSGLSAGKITAGVQTTPFGTPLNVSFSSMQFDFHSDGTTPYYWPSTPATQVTITVSGYYRYSYGVTMGTLDNDITSMTARTPLETSNAYSRSRHFFNSPNDQWQSFSVTGSGLVHLNAGSHTMLEITGTKLSVGGTFSISEAGFTIEKAD